MNSEEKLNPENTEIQKLDDKSMDNVAGGIVFPEEFATSDTEDYTTTYSNGY